ncbi:MAG: FlgO family outer membrane protein [Deltaproteobacteria bacterium]|nr:FlgO family outer membrane protein [Deltaproteobacteria bacterium]
MKRALQLGVALLLPVVLGAPQASRAARPKAEGPVAVLPFKNLNRDPEQEWMARGIAETLVSDLKRTSKLVVVERDQIERAMSEIALQQDGEVSTSNAVKVGKLVGARTIVLGSYQRAGSQLRLNARFVQTETGLVLDTAKVTGQAKQVFALQDRLVNQLLDLSSGRNKQARARKPPPATEKTLKAYRLYAMAMTTATDAGQAKLLREAVAEEPDFSYALDELDALEQRLKALDARAEAAMDARAREYRAILSDPEADPALRWQAATELQRYFQTNGHPRALLGLGREVHEMSWPAGMLPDPKVKGLLLVFFAHQQLRQTDRALAVGEEFLRQYPQELDRAQVSATMARLLQQRREEEALKASIDEALRAIDVKEAKLDAEACEEHAEYEAWAEALERCGRFVEAWEGEPALVHQLNRARWLHLEAHLELGRFDEARRLAAIFREKQPEEAERRALTHRMRRWPGAALLEPGDDPRRPPAGGGRALLLPFVRKSDGRETLRLGLMLPRAMAFDLERGGRQAVVDWDRLQDHLERTPRRGREIETIDEAAAIGEALEAEVVVIGTYSVANEQELEVHARKIDVRKKTVVGEVKVEGRSDDVLPLQDRILKRLFGDRFLPPKRAAATQALRGGKKPDPKAAYRLYNLSITGSDTTRFGLLDKALEEDPGFAYARNDFAALVFKAARNAALAHLPRAEQEQALRERFGSGENPSRRRSDMMEFFGLLERTSHQAELLTLARRIDEMTWPEEYRDTLRANAVYWMQKAYEDLKQPDQVIAMGKRYAAEFPKGHFHAVVVRNAERLEEKLAKEKAKQEERLPPFLARQEGARIALEGERCAELIKHRLHLRGRRYCQDFLERHRSLEGSEDYRVSGALKTASWKIVESHFELGEFQEARALGEAHLQRYPDDPGRAVMMSYWPRD